MEPWSPAGGNLLEAPGLTGRMEAPPPAIGRIAMLSESSSPSTGRI